MTTKQKRDIYEEVTNKVIEALENGVVAWHRPWRSAKAYNGYVPTHRNLASKRPYRGINVFLLDMAAHAAGYDSNYWLTYKQAQEKGGQVRHGEKGSLVVLWKPIIREVENPHTGETEKVKSFILRHYIVFNVEQCDGIEEPTEQVEDAPEIEEFSSIEAAQVIIDHMPKRPTMGHGGDRAYYAPLLDAVRLPKPEQFESPEHYYSTAFHELAHATGHTSRLNRREIMDLDTTFGDEKYSKEELTAEMAAAMLCGISGIHNAVADNSAAYIKNWLSKLRDDKRLVIQAAARAQKAADFILDARNGEEGE